MSEKDAKPQIKVKDRRFWAINENAEEEAAAAKEQYPSFVEELRAKAQLAEDKLRQKMDQLAEENNAYRTRLQADLERRSEARIAQIIGDFLEVVDNFERALETSDQATREAVAEGLQLNIQLFLSKLGTHDILPLRLVDQPFDPEQAEAVGTIPVNDPEEDGLVLEEIQRGYTYKDQLLRPARVRIGRFERDR